MTATMQEAAAPIVVVAAGDAHSEFSQQYSRGELEELDSRELLDRYAD